MLVKLGFNVSAGRILNPQPFCNDRDNYYHNLSIADKEQMKVADLCDMYKGLKDESKKSTNIDYGYLQKKYFYQR